ncbi:phosphoribosyltransferase family protein (plasmid) [Rhizobium sp. CB3090]|uniref:phosphoribosyltransferase n=1 Tax=Rhizobium sp. CB3090 TaxID=3039156 RepID=UPI0024B079B8|nr:phosphoribosyltransferase family protein [Rhizobium sp. CB3090]WFU13249.1 phosphoribosyltransferase family protein [Rhizobium sp. CB3090]
MFEDRTEAGRKLAKVLRHYRNRHVVVLGLPRGGVPVAFEIAKVLHAPMDIVFVRKVGLPCAPEVAMGAVVDGTHPHIYRNEAVIRRVRVTEEAFQFAAEEELREIARRKAVFKDVLPRCDIRGKTVILVDDGLATGSTMEAALSAIKGNGVGRTVIAVPVAHFSAISALKNDADEIICLETTHFFRGVGDFYNHFPQLSDDDVVGYLHSQMLAQDLGLSP